VLTTSRKARTDAQEFIEASIVFLKDDFLPKLVHCLEEMSDDDIWWRPNEKSNSVGNLILHLRGNLRQWIVAGLGGGSFERDRDAEFETRARVPTAELITIIRSAVNDAVKIFESLQPERLLDRYPVQTYSTSGLQAIYHVVEHFSYHLGQILYIYKMRTDIDPGFYSHLSKR